MSVFRAIGKFVSEFARMILFIASVVFLVSSSILLWFSFHSRQDFSYVNLENIDKIFTVCVCLSAYLLVLAMIGVYASFFSSVSTIKVLALMTALNVLVGVALITTESHRVDSLHEDLWGKLELFQHKYNWKHETTEDGAVKNATRAWDNIQADLECCGVKGPLDWRQVNPEAQEKKYMLPISCCKEYKTWRSQTSGAPVMCDATEYEFWDLGCAPLMEAVFVHIVIMVIFLVLFSLVVGILAAIVLCCRPSKKPIANSNASAPVAFGYPITLENVRR